MGPRLVTGWRGFLPDLRVNVDLWVIEGDLLIAAVTLTGTHQAEWMGVPATAMINDLFPTLTSGASKTAKYHRGLA